MAAETERWRWREKDIDNALMLELASGAPSEARIRELVGEGADVNSVKHDDSVLMDAMTWIQDGLDEHFIRLLVELGADVNYLTDDGGCPLVDACLAGSPALVEYLLERGADPNVVYDHSDTVLGSVETDVAYHEMLANGDPTSPDGQMARKFESIVAVLRRHGAMRLGELRADQVSRWIHVFGCGGTGLLTIRGYIDVEAIGGLTEAFHLDFKTWKKAFWDSWPHRDWSSKPSEFDRGKHNEWGRRLSRVIRAALPSEITVKHLSIDVDYEQKQIRSVNTETID